MATALTHLGGLGKGAAGYLRLLAWALWPRTCLACASVPVAGGDVGACPACVRSFVPNVGRRCRACDQPLAAGPAGVPCRCALRELGLVGARAVWRDEGAVARLLRAGKFAGQPAVFAALGRHMAHDAQARRLAAASDALVPVPTPLVRALRRGFNPCALLAHALGQALALPVDACLGAPARAAAAHLQGRRQRLQAGPTFVAHRRPPRRVLLVDDVLTTGATLRAATLALRRRDPAVQVAVLVVARRCTAGGNDGGDGRGTGSGGQRPLSAAR